MTIASLRQETLGLTQSLKLRLWFWFSLARLTVKLKMTTEPREAWNHSHHYIRTKTPETGPETPRSSVDCRTPCHKESWSEGWCQQYHARELSWKHLLENRLLDLGNRLKHILMERKRLKEKMKSDTEDGVELRGHGGDERTHHCYTTEHDRLRGQSAQPGCLWANVLEFAFWGIIALMTQPAEQCDRWVDSL